MARRLSVLDIDRCVGCQACMFACARRLGQGGLDRLGAGTLRQKYAFKQREGFDLGKVRIPRHILETAAPAGPFDEAFVRQAMARATRRGCREE